MKFTLKIKPGAIPLKLISVINNTLKLIIPRRFNFSGHFHLNTPHFSQKITGFYAHN